jgi:coproporphyrinogen III oxidase-like Fe-S oxidoreductase
MMSAQKVEHDNIRLAVAAHVYVDGFTLVKHSLHDLLEKIKQALNDQALTTRDIRQALAEWLMEGMAVIEDNYLRITRAGRHHVEQLAEVATSPAPLAA